MKKIAIITATRAEYCALVPLINKFERDRDIESSLIVTGAHLSKKFGYTITEIEKDGFYISHIIDIMADGNSAYDISVTMATAIEGFAECFRDDKPDGVILSGDRTEIIAVAIAAMNEMIPIFHIHGGEITEGAVDDCIRHALSKMSYLHFVSTECYGKRVIQLGENPSRVFNVGSLSVENILNSELLPEGQLRLAVGIPADVEYAVVTLHPVTLENDSHKGEINALCEAIKRNLDLFYVITASNADVGGETINSIWDEFCRINENAIFVKNLGMIKYLSAVKYAKMVIGNSSSGILEAPVLGTPTVNIGDRQKGRIMTDTIVNCASSEAEIDGSIKLAKLIKRKATNIYGDGHTSEKIVKIIKDFVLNDKINLKKGFYDLVDVKGISSV